MNCGLRLLVKLRMFVDDGFLIGCNVGMYAMT